MQPGRGSLLSHLQTDWITQCFHIVWTEKISLNSYTVFSVWGFQDISVFKKKNEGKQTPRTPEILSVLRTADFVQADEVKGNFKKEYLEACCPLSALKRF